MRDRVVIATKVFNAMGEDINERGLSRKHIRHAIDNSLRRLKMEYVDLYQIHRFDPATPIEETLDALNDVVKSGKASISEPHQCSRGSFQRCCMRQSGWGRRSLSRCKIITTSFIGRRNER